MAHETSTINAISRRPQEQMTRDEIIAFFDRRQAAFDRLDAEALAAQYAADCVVSSPAGGTHQGPAAVQRVMEGFFNAFLDMKVHTDSLFIDGNRVAQIVMMQGTHVADFMGLAGTGKPFEVPIAVFFELEDHLIVRERRIYDFMGLLVQIGVLKAKPA